MTTSEVDREPLADAFYEKNKELMTEGVVELWPSNNYLQYYNIRKSICNEGYHSVMRELQNTIRDPSQEVFDMESAVRFEVTEEGLQP